MTLRSILLTALPKVALSRLTGLLVATPLPVSLRGPAYRAFARRYGADLTEMAGAPGDYRSLATFFQRPLRPGARPVAAAPLVWPCDGRIVSSGPIDGERLPQVKGRNYALADLLGDRGLAAALAGGSQATIYLAPGDYHRVHAPFAAQLTVVVPLPGTLFPVNPPAVRCIDNLFPRNSRRVFHCRLGDGRVAAVVMVGAFNVGHIAVSAAIGAHLRPGDELGRFGFGSTVVMLLPPGAETIAALPPETRVRMGQASPLLSR